MINKMSSITFPDGSSYEVTDDKARKDITELNNDIDNVQGAIDELKGTIGYSKKNLLVYPYELTTVTQGNITFTDVGDGTIQTSGVSTGKASMVLSDRTKNKMLLKAGTYIINGCPKGGSTTTYMINVSRTVNGAGELIAQDTGDGATFTLTEDTYIGCLINIEASSVNLNNQTFYPMIRYASISDSTYEPYVDNVQTQLSDVKIELDNKKYNRTIVLQQTLTDVNKPWLELKAQFNKMEDYYTYSGRISCGVTYGFTGYSIWDKTYASYFIHGYDANVYHVINRNGTWQYAKIATSYTTF